MSEKTYIQDDFGNQIQLLDSYGNLSIEVIMLYTEDKLTSTDRKIVDDFAATDKMSKDALEGFALTSNAGKTRFNLGELNAGIQKQSGAKAVATFPIAQDEFDYRKLAAAIALLIVIGGGTFFVSNYFGKTELAENVVKEEPSTYKLKEAPVSILVESDSANSVEEETNVRTSEVLDTKQLPQPEKAKSEAIVIEEVELMDSEAELEEIAEVLIENASDIRQMPGRGNASVTTEAAGVQESIGQIQTVSSKDDFAADEVVELAVLKSEEQARKELESVSREQLAKASNVESERKRKVQESSRLAAAEESSFADRDIAQEASRNNRQETAAETVSNTETSAKFPGGDIEMYKFIENQKRYTAEMANQNLNGVIIVLFEIDKDGSVNKPEIKSGVNGPLNADALRVVSAMPKWQPAKRPNGNPVKSARTVVIRYGND